MAKGDRSSDGTAREVRERRPAETILTIIHDRGKGGLPWYDVSRQLLNPDLYLRASARRQQKAGATTPGPTDETVDGMSQAKITKIIEVLRYARWRWTPVRRVELPTSHGKTRPLGLPTWSDKRLQEGRRARLEADDAPQCSDHSHGFRPQKGCHTALTKIPKTWSGTKGLIEGDIRGGVDHSDHPILMTILREPLHENRFLRLIEGLLKAGYWEAWTSHPTLSGTPQGGVVSPMLSTIDLDRLDRVVMGTLIPEWTRGKTRKAPPVYQRRRA